jgi:anti-sigma factor RsiW
MPCPDPLVVHAYCDGELDAASVVAVEQHLGSCLACQALQRDIESVRVELHRSASYYRLAPARRAALLRGLPLATAASPALWRRSRLFWSGAAAGLAAAAGAFALATTLQWGAPSPVVNDVLAAHVRSLLSERLIDVASSDRHTVKPWFAGRVEVSPPVADYAAQGYPLVGGRVDYVDGRRAATTVYRHGAHVINVFAWPATRSALPSRLETRNGYQIACWMRGAIDFCAVSDTAGEELLPLTRLLQAMGEHDPRE